MAAVVYNKDAYSVDQWEYDTEALEEDDEPHWWNSASITDQILHAHWEDEEKDRENDDKTEAFVCECCGDYVDNYPIGKYYCSTGTEMFCYYCRAKTAYALLDEEIHGDADEWIAKNIQ